MSCVVQVVFLVFVARHALLVGNCIALLHMAHVAHFVMN